MHMSFDFHVCRSSLAELRARILLVTLGDISGLGFEFGKRQEPTERVAKSIRRVLQPP